MHKYDNLGCPKKRILHLCICINGVSKILLSKQKVVPYAKKNKRWREGMEELRMQRN